MEKNKDKFPSQAHVFIACFLVMMINLAVLGVNLMTYHGLKNISSRTVEIENRINLLEIRQKPNN